MKAILWVVAAGILLSLVSCGQSDAEKQREADAYLQLLGEKFVKAKLKDPSSAEFRNQFIGKKGVPCGEVNAKNSFGGFTGFHRYIAVGAELTVFPNDMPVGEFDSSWSLACK